MGELTPPQDESIETQPAQPEPQTEADDIKEKESRTPEKGLARKILEAKRGITEAEEKFASIHAEAVLEAVDIRSKANPVLEAIDKGLQHSLRERTDTRDSNNYIDRERSKYYEGELVSQDGRRIKVFKRTTTRESVEAKDASNKYNVEEAKRLTELGNEFTYIYLEDPEDSTIRVGMSLGSWDDGFAISEWDANGKHVRGKKNVGIQPINQPEYDKIIKFHTDGIQDTADLEIDPFDIAKRTVEFAETATLKPVAGPEQVAQPPQEQPAEVAA